MVGVTYFPGSCLIRDLIGAGLSGKSDHFLPWLRSTQGVVREVGIYADFDAGVSDQFHLVCVRAVVTRCLE